MSFLNSRCAPCSLSNGVIFTFENLFSRNVSRERQPRGRGARKHSIVFWRTDQRTSHTNWKTIVSAILATLRMFSRFVGFSVRKQNFERSFAELGEQRSSLFFSPLLAKQLSFVQCRSNESLHIYCGFSHIVHFRPNEAKTFLSARQRSILWA